MSEEAAFLAGIRVQPKDDLRRLVYADWLDERGDGDSRAKAEYLRLDVHVSGLADDHPERDDHILALRNLAERLPLDWKAAVAKAPIENCGVRWRFQCPKKWDRLEETRTPEVRYCTACRKDVFFCDSVEKARRLAETLGHCVVIDLGVRRKAGDMDLLRGPAELELEPMMTMGIIAPDYNFGATGYTAPESSARPGLFRRLWRRLTGK